MKPVDTKQIKAFNSILSKLGLANEKRDIIEQISGGRTRSTKELTWSELQSWLNSAGPATRGLQAAGLPKPDNSRLMSKLFAMAHEMQWITYSRVVDTGGKIRNKKDYSHVHAWVEKYGYLKKPLNEYSYNELPKLVTQFELGPYRDYLKP
ncbi:MAG: hypothetical protein J0M30_14740 [Chitinophagales bacterium]|nr:hypothetical protein [Chitinophagales bacterium]